MKKLILVSLLLVLTIAYSSCKHSGRSTDNKSDIDTTQELTQQQIDSILA